MVDKRADSKLMVGIAYTVPNPYEGAVPYTKGSGYWQETFAAGLHKDGRFDVYTMGPTYELWHAVDKPYAWRDIPIIHRPPKEFPPKNYGKRWEPPKNRADIGVLMHGFTRAGQGKEKSGWDVWADAGPQAFRAIVEVTRWYLDWIPVLNGRETLDVYFPQHVSANIIAGSNYFHRGNAVAISHETCIRCDNENMVGGWAAKRLRPYILDALDLDRTEEDAPPIIAISNLVKEMLMANAGIPESRIKVVRNPYNTTNFFRIPNLTKEGFIDEIRKNWAENVDVPTDMSTEGKWAVFVGRPAEFKGVEQLLSSWAVYLNNHKEANANDILFVIGPELDNHSHFAKLAKELGISANVRFLGPKPPAFINKLHNASDIAVMTSLNEGDGVVAKEPGAAGQRVVVTRSGGPMEYFHPMMGTLVESRDPTLKSSSRRGYELLQGSKTIEWGEKTLTRIGIISDHISWLEFYAGGVLSDEVQAKVDSLEGIIKTWDSRPILDLRAKTIEVLRNEAEGKQPAYVPSELRENVKLLSEVFRAYGGRDVEIHSLAEGYREELHQDYATRMERKDRARDYVLSQFSSKAHARTIGDILYKAANQTFNVEYAPEEGWSKTVVEGFAMEDHPLAAVIPLEARQVVRDAFDDLRYTTNDVERIHAAYKFSRAMVKILGNPEIYPDRWPTPAELAMKYDHRSENVIAAIAGLDAHAVAQVRHGLVSEIGARPELGEALHMMQLGQHEKVNQMLKMGGGYMLPRLNVMRSRGLIR